MMLTQKYTRSIPDQCSLHMARANFLSISSIFSG